MEDSLRAFGEDAHRAARRETRRANSDPRRLQGAWIFCVEPRTSNLEPQAANAERRTPNPEGRMRSGRLALSDAKPNVAALRVLLRWLKGRKAEDQKPSSPLPGPESFSNPRASLRAGDAPVGRGFRNGSSLICRKPRRHPCRPPYGLIDRLPPLPTSLGPRAARGLQPDEATSDGSRLAACRGIPHVGAVESRIPDPFVANTRATRRWPWCYAICRRTTSSAGTNP